MSPNVHTVELLTRAGCSLCDKAATVLAALVDEYGIELSTTDVDAAAEAGDPSLRAEYGDLLPVVLLDGSQHSYWEVDEARLRADLGDRRAGA
jgi:glutaredoxin